MVTIVLAYWRGRIWLLLPEVDPWYCRIFDSLVSEIARTWLMLQYRSPTSEPNPTQRETLMVALPMMKRLSCDYDGGMPCFRDRKVDAFPEGTLVQNYY